jgi:hypothetical protein
MLTAPHVTSLNTQPLVPDKGNLENHIVLPGTASRAVIMACPANVVNIGAQYAVQFPTMCRAAMLSSDLLVVNTPFIANKWYHMLINTPSFNIFSDVPIGICYGFDMGINTLPTHTYIPSNHNSTLLHPNHVMSHISNELLLCCYSGPFSSSRLEALLGPFHTSPLGTVLKSPTSEDCRIVQDLFFFRNDLSHCSINNYINIEDFRCNWGTFNNVRAVVLDAPTGTEAVTLDVDSPFRCCPIIPTQQPNFII